MKFSKGAKTPGEMETDDETAPGRCGGGQTMEEEEEEAYTDRGSGGSGFSVAKVERYLRLVEPVKDPIQALFGIGLLFYGRSFAHLILFTQVPGLSILPRPSSPANPSQPCT